MVAARPIAARISPAGSRLLLLAVLCGCISEPVVDAQPSSAEVVAQASRTFSQRQLLSIRMSCLAQIQLELAAEAAQDTILRLFAGIERERMSRRADVDDLIGHTAQLLLRNASGEAACQRALGQFRASTSNNVRQLTWLLAASLAARDGLTLPTADVFSAYREVEDHALRLQILDGIGYCRDATAWLPVLERELSADWPGDLRYPGLVPATRGYSSILLAELQARRQLAAKAGHEPRQPLVVRFGTADQVPDSTPLIVQRLLQVALDPDLRQFDLFLIASFLKEWAPRELPRLGELDVTYDLPETRHELGRWIRRRR